MGINVDIRIDLSPKQKKIVRAAVVTGSVIAALGIGIAIAAPHQWKATDPLAAGDLNGLNVLSYTSDAGVTTSYSVGATRFCGITPTTTTGQVVYAATTGYAGVKKACENVSSCGNSPTAHMCTSEEMARSSELGVPTATGWITSGAPGGGTGIDCYGWTNGTVSYYGPAWDNVTTAGGTPNSESCNSVNPILCCD